LQFLVSVCRALDWTRDQVKDEECWDFCRPHIVQQYNIFLVSRDLYTRLELEVGAMEYR